MKCPQNADTGQFQIHCLEFSQYIFVVRWTVPIESNRKTKFIYNFVCQFY